MRRFELISKYQNQDELLPVRQTKGAAGYDFKAAEDIVIPTKWPDILKKGVKQFFLWGRVDAVDVLPTLVPTGVKAKMPKGEVLILANRSSSAIKRNLLLVNGIGVIDSDYYNNPSNEGHIMIALINWGPKDIHIKKGERIAQGIFQPYLLTDDDNGGCEDRQGGMGSTKQ